MLSSCLRQLILAQWDSQSLVFGDPFRAEESRQIVPNKGFMPSTDEMGSCYPAADEYSDFFRADLSWDDWLLSGLVAEPDFNMPHDCPLPASSASRYPSLDSNASSDQLVNQGWPVNFLENPQLNLPSCPQTTAQQDIESCIPNLPQQPSPMEPPPTTTPNSSPPPPPTKRRLSPIKRKHGPRIDPSPPAKEPVVAKKDSKTKTSSSTRTAHSVIEHNYRKNLNTKMEQLRQILSVADSPKHISPELDNKNNSDNGIEANNNPSTTTITRKSDVLLHAYSYVKRSEREKKTMADENAFLKRRLVALEKLVGCEDCSLLKRMNMLQMGGV